MRSRVLRKLYLPSLSKTTLLRGIRQQFVDAFLATCKVEIFSPGEDILQRGSIASDLYLLVSGSATMSTYDPKVDNSGRGSVGGSLVEGVFDGTTKRIDSGQFINEVGFFTESPQIETVRTVGVCKTLTMPRAGYKLIAEDHPGSAGKILENLLRKVEAQAKSGSSQAVNLPTKLELLRAGSVFEGASAKEDSTAIEAQEHAKAALSTTKDLIAMHIEKQKDDQTTRFLFAASRGDMGTIKQQ